MIILKEESKDHANTKPTHMIILQFYITYKSEDSAGYEPIDKEEDYHNLSGKKIVFSRWMNLPLIYCCSTREMLIPPLHPFASQ